MMLEGELRKLKPPTFDGQNLGDNAELWLMEMDKYLQLHNYSENQEARIAIYILQGRAYKW